MKVKTKKRICAAILFFNAFGILGVTGNCEHGVIGGKEWLIYTVLFTLFSIIPAAKLGYFEEFKK